MVNYNEMANVAGAMLVVAKNLRNKSLASEKDYDACENSVKSLKSLMINLEIAFKEGH